MVRVNSLEISQQKQTHSIEDYHKFFLYPVVRIFSERVAGSGTIIYSEKDIRNPEEYLTFVLTNYHVIGNSITVSKEWNSILRRDIKKEIKEKVKVENFQYINLSLIDSSNRYNADIIAYDQNHDLAILMVNSPRQFPYTAKLIPEDKIKDLRLFMEVVITGCSLAHEPFSNFGQITYLSEIIERKKYMMVNAGMYFGNSGGALFLKDSGWFIGVPSRLTGIQLGFGFDMITFMGFSAHPERLYEFLKEQELQFIYDPNDDYYGALERRKRREKEALMALKAEFIKDKEINPN